MKGLFKILIVMVSLAVASPAGAGSLYLTGHDVLFHSGQSGYWRVILDYLRGVGGTGTVIPEANYDIAFLCVTCRTSSLSGYTGTITTYNPATMTTAQWADAFTRDILVIPWSPDINTAAAKTALNAKSAEIETFFNAGGDIWMNSSGGATDYYTILPSSVLSDGNTISGSSGFTATAQGAAIGITSGMINGNPTHNNFTSVGAGLIIYEENTGVPISIGVQDASIVGGIITTGPTVPVPTLSEWALILLSLLMAGVALLRIRRNAV